MISWLIFQKLPLLNRKYYNVNIIFLQFISSPLWMHPKELFETHFILLHPSNSMRCQNQRFLVLACVEFLPLGGWYGPWVTETWTLAISGQTGQPNIYWLALIGWLRPVLGANNKCDWPNHRWWGQSLAYKLVFSLDGTWTWNICK